MNKEWPIRVSEIKEMFYFFTALVPYLGGAIATSVIAFFLLRIIGENGELTIFYITIPSVLFALFFTYRRYPAYLRSKSALAPKITFDGKTLRFPVLAGGFQEMLVTEELQIEFAYFHQHGTSSTGVLRGLWLELKSGDRRVLFTGVGDFKLSPDKTLPTKVVPHAPHEQKVATYADVLLEIYETLQNAAHQNNKRKNEKR